ncbi:hypothetical protein GQ457_17G016000 [Hibiscus cannabinus]
MVSDEENCVARLNSSETNWGYCTDDPFDEYYIHPNENPSLVLTSELITGVNYHVWARSMKMSLISKNKFQFVNGVILESSPEDSRFQA